MSHINSNIITDISPDIKAYIYQKTLDLQAFTGPDVGLGVLIKKNTKTNGFEAEWHLEINGNKVVASAKADDMVLALKDSSEKMLKTLEGIQSQVIESLEGQNIIQEPIVLH